jgi:hypothetical protein
MGPAALVMIVRIYIKKMRRFDVRLFMDAVDFLQNGGAGWKHARRSDCGGWKVCRP